MDCSTSACKAIVWDPQGNVVAKGSSSLSLISPQPSWYEQSAESWWTATVQALKQAVSQVEVKRLKALCIAHQRETFVPVDEQSRPLSNGILWMDERAGELLPNLEQSFDQEKFRQQTGKRLSVNLTIGKIAWLKKNRPDIFNKTHKYLDVQAFLVHRLTGQYRTGNGSADPTGMFDMRNNRWAGNLLDEIGIRPDQLPEISTTGTEIGTVVQHAAEECGLPVGLPVIAGLGDGQASGLGANITKPGEAYLSLGTSVVSGTYSARYIVDPAFRTMTGGIPESYLLETVLLGGGHTISWFLEKIARRKGEDPAPLRDSLEKSSNEIPPGSMGLMVVPYWNSVLGPYWDPDARGIVVGWHNAHQLSHFYRAILEGIAFELRLENMGVENALGQIVKRFVVTGGGAQSNLWCQIIADVTDRQVLRTATTDAAALGAGILAATAAGCFADVRQAAQEMSHTDAVSFEPDPSRHGFYDELFENVYRDLFPALRNCLSRLTSLSDFKKIVSDEL